MKKADVLKRMNEDHARRVMHFNSLPPQLQAQLVEDKSFWQHDCRLYRYRDRCLDCGRSFIHTQLTLQLSV